MNRLERLHSTGITATSAESLAAVYGMGMSLDEYAEALRPGTRILDVGAGRSSFLLEIASRRDEVEATALDYRYRDPHVVNPLRAIARNRGLSNIEYISGDVFKPSENLFGQFDLVLSAGLVEHAIRVSREYGRVALENIVSFAAPAGQVCLRRPRFAKLVSGLNIVENMVILDATAEAGQIEKALEAMELTRWADFFQDMQDASKVKVQPARKLGEGRGWLLYEDGSTVGFRPYSKHGRVLGRRLLKGFSQRDKYSEPPSIRDYIAKNS
ncbi:MAG TPA: methyltransferase domain-containing protein [Candidatus Saccharimonadia bacterium]|nr:methyltransferase domain-containing protein [Candidatus Saccharimonadia bacterium]